MSGFVVVERLTGPVEDKEDSIFGPFQAVIVAELWIEKRKKEVKTYYEFEKQQEFHRRNPRIYFVKPLYEPNW